MQLAHLVRLGLSPHFLEVEELDHPSAHQDVVAPLDPRHPESQRFGQLQHLAEKITSPAGPQKSVSSTRKLVTNRSALPKADRSMVRSPRAGDQAAEKLS